MMCFSGEMEGQFRSRLNYAHPLNVFAFISIADSSAYQLSIINFSLSRQDS